PSSDLVVYSDGSRLAGNKAGAACVGFQGSTEVLRASISLGDAVEVPDAEAFGVAAALTAAANRDSHSAIHVYLDNLSVAARASCPHPSRDPVRGCSTRYEPSLQAPQSLWDSAGAPGMPASEATRRPMPWQKRPLHGL